MHVPIETARGARAKARRVGADCAVAIGGGSTTGLGKAIALGRDARVLPAAVLYDPELTLTLRLALTVTSAMNAIAHAAEGLCAHDGNPVMSLMAEEGIRAAAAARRRCSRTSATSTRARPLRRVAARHGARQRRHGAAPQALPHARRHVQRISGRRSHWSSGTASSTKRSCTIS
jgi:alcohol dehydrogenase class IV